MAIDPINLDAIKARAAAATVGPWEAQPRTHSNESIVVAHGLLIAVSKPCAEVVGEPFDVRSRANAEFIAHAREDIDLMAAEIDSLRAERDLALSTLTPTDDPGSRGHTRLMLNSYGRRCYDAGRDSAALEELGNLLGISADEARALLAHKRAERKLEAPMTRAQVEAAIRAFLAKWDGPDGAEKAINGMCSIGAVHGMPYAGPTLADELAALRAALPAAPTAAETREREL